MIFFKEIDKNDNFNFPIGDIYNIEEFSKLDNDAVAECTEDFFFLNAAIKKQNNRGFVSVLHIKNAINGVAHESILRIEKQHEQEYVQGLLRKFKVSPCKFDDVLSVIDCLSNGKRIWNGLERAYALVEYNQKEGTGDWLIFLRSENANYGHEKLGDRDKFKNHARGGCQALAVDMDWE